MPEAPLFLETYSLVTRVAVAVVLFGGLAVVLARSDLSTRTGIGIWLTLFLVTLIWFIGVFYVARLGLFQAGTTRVPLIPFAVFVPLGIGLWLLVRSDNIAKVIDATPASWLVGVQMYRVIGGIFLVMWSIGLLPGQFALPAGAGDVLVGVLALVVAIMLARRVNGARTAAYGWNALGIIDLLLALTLGFLSSPGPFQMLALDNPNILTTAYPTVLIPAFAVPLSLILHGLSIWKLQRDGARDTPT